MKLPQDYVLSILNQYSRKVQFIRATNSYRASCPWCREGDSWGKKTRLNWYINNDVFVCYNCHKASTSLFFVKEITGQNYSEIIKESKTYDYCSINMINEEDEIEKIKTPTLPHNCINLSDPVQLKYYASDKQVQTVMRYIKNRRLDKAINSTTFYLSLTDFLHSNRLIIPFRNSDNKINFYQSRALYSHQNPKYLGQLNQPKAVFGLEHIDINLDYLFILEGPIDSMFVKNGISMAGLKMSEFQRELLSPYQFHKKIWILDNELDHPDVYKKNMDLVDQGERVFVWPKHYKEYKDLNELCCKLNINYINPDFFIQNSYEGLEAKQQLALHIIN